MATIINDLLLAQTILLLNFLRLNTGAKMPTQVHLCGPGLNIFPRKRVNPIDINLNSNNQIEQE